MYAVGSIIGNQSCLSIDMLASSIEAYRESLYECFIVDSSRLQHAPSDKPRFSGNVSHDVFRSHLHFIYHVDTMSIFAKSLHCLFLLTRKAAVMWYSKTSST